MQSCGNGTKGLITPSNLPHTCANQTSLQTIFTIFFVSLGAIAILMIVIAGFRYVVAQGEPNKITQAKNMILYSVIGLIIAATAAAFVSFVLGRVQ